MGEVVVSCFTVKFHVKHFDTQARLFDAELF